MVLSLTIMTAVSAAILGSVKMFSEPRAAAALDRQKREALASVLPAFRGVESAQTADGLTVYRATDGNGQSVGVAVESFSDAGFAGRITVLFGFNADGSLRGYNVLSHSETPGLGANMATWFCADGTTHNVLGTTGPLKVSKDGGSVDAITGATITSRAFLEALDRARAAAFARQ